MSMQENTKRIHIIRIAVIAAVALCLTVLSACTLKFGIGSSADKDTTVITLSGDHAKIMGDGADSYDNRVVISSAGDYVISGKLTDGTIAVSADDSAKVRIKLDGVSVYCSDDAAFRVDRADEVILTLADGTSNSFESGAEYSDEALSDDTGGVIFAHDDLTIEGDGSLTVTAAYKHGIECNDSLVLSGGKITISAAEDGINANESVKITDAVLSVHAGDDGINGGKAFLMEGGTVNIDECYEGIEAYTLDIRGGDIMISCTDDGLNASDKSKKDKESPDEDDDKDDDMPRILVSGGNITVINETGEDADGLDSNGDIMITGGNVRVSLADIKNNSAIDWGIENGGVCEISGGTVIACGNGNMAEPFDTTSKQCGILYFCNESMASGTTVTLSDEKGNTVLEWEVPCSFSAISLSCPEILTGRSYTLITGDEEEAFSIEEISSTFGVAPKRDFGPGKKF